MKMLSLSLCIYCILIGAVYAADTISSKVKARPRPGISTTSSLRSSSTSKTHLVVEMEKSSFSIFDEVKEEILYIGEGFIDAESAAEVVEHASEVLDRHKGLIIGGLGITFAVRSILSPAKGAAGIGKNSALNLRAAEAKKWGTRKF